MFFFVVGLEIKRELMVGELASPRRAALPLAAALGGMVVPAVIYTVVNFGTPEVHGWGIPMATDIAFSLGILYLLGDRVPAGLRIFLASLAIADDLGAVIVIALFYTSNISYLSLVSGLGVLALVALLNFLGVRSTLVYGLFGIGGVWLAFLFSGVHPTIAGVLMAMLIPANMKLNPVDFVAKSRATVDHFEKAGHPSETVLVNQNRHAALMQLDVHTRDALTPLQRLEISLHPWVSILILPLFALANAGVVLEGDLATLITQPVTLGVIAGLVIGKQVGVSAFAWMAVRFGLASLPDGISWKHIYGVSWLAGIGFTMSLFIAGLAFVNPEHLAMAKVGVLVGSLIAGFVGFAALRAMGR
jgi:NhaA family Na+:H+ antiporter